MKSIILTAAAVQLTTLIRPLLGAAAYLTTRDTLASQRTSILNAVATSHGGGGVDSGTGGSRRPPSQKISPRAI